jgi:hypothetical protein
MELAWNQLSEKSSKVSWQPLRANWLIQHTYRIKKALEIAMI